MFIGHYGVSLVAAARPKAPGLGTLFVAAQLIDYGFFTLVLLGVEHLRLVPGITRTNAMDLYDMPWTHSLIGASAWAIGFALLLWQASLRPATAMIGGAVVLSHWLLDLLVHRPDLTIADGPPPLGLGLWNLPAIEKPLEIVLALGTLWWFVRRSEPVSGAGRWSPLVLAAAMLLLQTIDWTTPQPPAIVDHPPASGAWLGLFAYTLLAAIAWWVSRTRRLSDAAL